MLEIRLNCENCNKQLSNDSSEAMICTYECTFCKDCVENVLQNVCPNCGGGFEKRPTRPKEMLKKHPARDSKIYKPVIENKYLELYVDINPRER
ncbi:DUF1272 domain-containing protein [Marivirga harenae]|uniref:DUF1272 domain-containing protein n=1 Tax=Marivirga harenae TaxID=2010992 RepID=UPI0026DEFF74|nr:DUF1272 domain-containing protein [Marivirga harenae]WKV11144.1 DUF1272 domain-containing protein [Marivirga harenae]|tara:strand:- start:1568 stop:1849 length:282 start_codon:yes stop_codon:yes gene_type:complete